MPSRLRTPSHAFGGRCSRARAAGFTLPELMTVIAIAGILVAMAVPSFTGIIERNRMRNAVEQLRSDLKLARSESLRRNANVTVSFQRNTDGSTWCYGLTLNASCDCTATSGTTVCQLDTGVSTVVSSANFRGITSTAAPFASGGGNLVFSAARPTLASGSARFTSSPTGYEARVVVAGMGRISLCSPAGTTKLSYFDPCS